MAAYGEATIRAAIKTVLEGVSNVGKVYDYERFNSDWNELISLFKVTIGGTDQLRGWTITLQEWGEELITFRGGGVAETKLVSYRYRVYGILGVDDSAATEKTLLALALSIAQALDESSTLRVYDQDRAEPLVAAGSVEYKMFAGVLVNYVELDVRPQEVV